MDTSEFKAFMSNVNSMQASGKHNQRKKHHFAACTSSATTAQETLLMCTANDSANRPQVTRVLPTIKPKKEVEIPG